MSSVLIKLSQQTIMVSIILSVYPILSEAAGSSSQSSPVYLNAKMLSAEIKSMRQYEIGLKHKEKALAREAKAKTTTKEKSKDKLIVKAQKEFQKAIERQSKAVKFDQENYKAFNELGYALRKTGELRKAVGAYNYALKLNPRYFPAWEYRGEALLKLELFSDAKQSYMVLFKNNRKLASQLMSAFDQWISKNSSTQSEQKREFVEWVTRRKQLAAVSFGFSKSSKNNW